jgi:hypothetical protein
MENILRAILVIFNKNSGKSRRDATKNKPDAAKCIRLADYREMTAR